MSSRNSISLLVPLRYLSSHLRTYQRIVYWRISNSTLKRPILVLDDSNSNLLESKDSFYHTLLLTNLLKDIDSIHVLPSSVYSMLFLIAVLSKDEISCIQAESLLLELIQRHSGFKLDLVRCVPSQEVLLSIWDLFGAR